jgi:hypothetical protein
MGVPCVKCGYCCTVGPCAFGDWDPERRRCRHLTDGGLCARHAEIVEAERGAAVRFPMFGCGCSSPLFNSVREAKLAETAGAEGENRKIYGFADGGSAGGRVEGGRSCATSTA